MGVRRHLLAGAIAVAVVAASATAAVAAPSAVPGAVGHDISFPQCSGTATSASSLGGDFGIVGVTNGKPWSTSPCIAAEYQWAAARPSQPGLYANTANPAPTSSYYWPTTGASDPALCRDSTSTADAGCAYDYGWHAAANALGTAVSTVGSAASTLPWWLDVESANSWNGNASANAADLQGAVDYLRGQGVPTVGIYALPGEWATITGGYSTANAASYASQWAAEFTPAYPMSQSPTWVAGAGTASSASTTCNGSGLTGPSPRLAQFADGSGFDADLVCGAAATTQSLALSTNPTSASVRRGTTATSTVTLTEQGAAQAVTLRATSSPAGPALTLNPSTLPGPGTSTLGVATGAVNPGTYVVTVTATTAGGTTASARFTVTVRKR